MSRLKRLARVAVVRRRIRDQASAVVTKANEKLGRSVEEERRIIDNDRAFQEGLGAVFEQLEDAAGLFLIEAERKGHREARAAAAAAVKAQEKAAEGVREALRIKTLELRRTERVMERERSALKERQDKSERKLVDDLVGAKWSESA